MNMDLMPSQQVFYVEGNSLDVLPKMINEKMKFDVVLLDGDHNYYTVAKEMALIGELVQPNAMIICDDYSGRWAEKDMWYAERKGYEGNKHVTAPIETEKHGVKIAIDEWLNSHPEWQKAQPIPGEPILLVRKVI